MHFCLHFSTIQNHALFQLKVDSEIGGTENMKHNKLAAAILSEGSVQQTFGKLSLQFNFITLNFAVSSLPWNFAK